MSDDRLIPAALAIDALPVTDARAAFDVAAGNAYRGVAFATSHPELGPESLGPSARRHVRTILAGKRLQVESLRAAGAGRGGLTDPATIDRTLDNARQALTLARELRVPTVTMNIGELGGKGVPEETVVAALRELAQQADASGLTLALSAGGADGTAGLRRILKAVDFDRARLNLDGARLIGDGEDVLKTATEMAGGIGQFTASDAVRGGRAVRAAMLGEGQLPLKEVHALLREQGFHGPWVVDVRSLADGIAGARHAADVLRRLLVET